jgi:glycosyltransferase involved in cell wall biosynthesis
MIRRRKVILLLDLPPPLHGMSAINKAFVEHAAAEIGPVKVINTVPSYASSLWRTKYWFFFKAIHSVWCLFQLVYRLLGLKKCIIYRPINGGIGQVYDLVYLFIARIFGNKIYIHHHSFNYLNSKSRLFAIANIIAGKSAVHIVLGPKMKSDLARLYGIDQDRIRVISNLAFFDLQLNQAEINSSIRLGHLANLCIDKGIDTFIEVCKLLEKNNVNFVAEIAGPFADDYSKKLVTNAVKEYKQIGYLGPLYKNDKDEFYANLDCFIFPSKYKNEAEPLVLFEAANTGALIVGSQRGCMQDVINDLDGVSISESKNLAQDIAHAVIDAHKKQKLSKESKQARLKLFQYNHTRAKRTLQSFIKELSDYELSKTR